MIVAIVCLSLIVLLLGTLLRMAVTLRRQARFEQNRHQAECLAESGVERAAYQLVMDADYRGETWRLGSDEMGGMQAGQVTIEVDTAAPDTAQRRVTVEAMYPAEGRTFARHTKQILVAVGVPP